VRKREISKGGCLFTVGTVGLFAFLGIYKLATGRFPEYWEYALWALIALSIVADVYFGILDAIDESTAEIKGELGRLEDKITEEIKRLERK
jgi:hypothetical protein